MELQPYVEAVRHELSMAAASAGEAAQELADRLSAPLQSAMRLALLEALSAAAEEITGELAPRSVEVRLRGRDPVFVVTTPPGEYEEAGFVGDGGAEPVDKDFTAQYDSEGGTWRVTLRLPEGLRNSVESAARRDGSSLNTWLVRAAAVASQVSGYAEPSRSTRSSGHRVTGWVR